ncbi:FKBP-type peptidyl-prolyl cis-trans isomerase [Gelidibacter japonicus]|uniref:FKBP-type peptidyl-prolyl cis-trans isomerase n=1 Tax=Gelidibacter japonicus TaxID=1962232 RepID=UPI00201FE807|nr:FKBP-type peptidyl-prolyl cis-trans isomerase [Gelidibacter japonicus]MCL8007616.1 FKBP-type peptidyl-prolyl cis-trans isomerase [Gelidibacter japonicus]
MKKHVLIVLVFAFLTACNSDDTIDYKAKNNEDILAYIDKNNLEAQKSGSGLYYIIDEPGSGKQPVATSNVTVAYKGYFLDGKTFDQSDANGISFGLQQVIKGWTEGITYFKEGGKGKLLIPSHLGYGSKGRTGIPGGAVLIFDIHLISVN